MSHRDHHHRQPTPESVLVMNKFIFLIVETPIMSWWRRTPLSEERLSPSKTFAGWRLVTPSLWPRARTPCHWGSGSTLRTSGGLTMTRSPQHSASAILYPRAINGQHLWMFTATGGMRSRGPGPRPFQLQRVSQLTSRKRGRRRGRAGWPSSSAPSWWPRTASCSGWGMSSVLTGNLESLLTSFNW